MEQFAQYPESLERMALLGRAPATSIPSRTEGLDYATPLLAEKRPSAPAENQRLTNQRPTSSVGQESETTLLSRGPGSAAT